MDSQTLDKMLIFNQLDLIAKYKAIVAPLAYMIAKNMNTYCLTNCPNKSFICVRDKPRLPIETLNSIQKQTKQLQDTEEHKDPSSNGTKDMLHYETYKQLKEVSTKHEPGVSKTELYENLLKPFKHAKRVETLPVSGRTITVYICKYEDCNREFTKIWNLVDHARMHEGIRPYKCSFCSKAFTQKGNLKKHSKQHQHRSIEERRQFQCQICKKRYTEKYNLTAHLRTHKQDDIHQAYIRESSKRERNAS
ncbi:unnamed protein product [Moneuplotes crassus]|uniref:C2H2-type domain-containing protein n=1 Tax=Euplotes crassus TaxID=5936 RepID=A0AAD1YB57_EUPCR|nr:unnamed protein product [Moneuplotes crassus]